MAAITHRVLPGFGLALGYTLVYLSLLILLPLGGLVLKAVSYTHLRAHETVLDPVCRPLLEKKKRRLRGSRRSVGDVSPSSMERVCGPPAGDLGQ